ncbi:MAG: hypothetical protein Q8R85_06105 [Bosea sp. (in: a-proteobacteria)]|jgi:hypothetical protein|uniref:hypothetical protein n=1 Tax=Hyphomicrobiales TaxID=356 RepID=UPI00083695C6|nr:MULTISPECIES: hypothetical protein [Hyphomicrobiales]MDP3600729.1 hypothetical protein [Bosea sp. (in: a-proteobacteria)]
MDRDDVDNLARDLLGRPLTAAEHRDLLPAIAAFRLKPGSPVAVLLILYQSLRTGIAQANAAAIATHTKRRRARRALGMALAAVLSSACVVLGYAIATRQFLREMDPAVRWTLSEEGKRAKWMSDAGLLDALDRCTIPGWTSQPPFCFPGPDPESGTVRGIRTRP